MGNIEFTQSQGHGLYWDSEIRESVFKLYPCKNDTRKYDIENIENIFNSSKNDTRKYDIENIENIFNSNENISIKTSSSNGFGGGDILRFII